MGIIDYTMWQHFFSSEPFLAIILIVIYELLSTKLYKLNRFMEFIGFKIEILI